jgi:hypothetical protein
MASRAYDLRTHYKNKHSDLSHDHIERNGQYGGLDGWKHTMLDAGEQAEDDDIPYSTYESNQRKRPESGNPREKYDSDSSKRAQFLGIPGKIPDPKEKQKRKSSEGESSVDDPPSKNPPKRGKK